MKRTATAAIVACGILLAASLASPAFGGPSLGSVAKTAKRALATSKSASRSAASAQRTASSASRLAATANGKADQALARPVVDPAGIVTVKATGTIEASGIGGAAATCAAGQRVISGGVVTSAGAGGTWLDRASDTRTAWLGGGEDLGGSGGEVTVYAYCVRAGAAAVAGGARAKARAELRAAMRARTSVGGARAEASH